MPTINRRRSDSIEGGSVVLIALVLALLPSTMDARTTAASPTISATIDTDERQTTPVPHRYVHGVIPDDAKFQLALPENWNGKLAIFSRGFSGTELSTGSFKTTALEKGYAFAASDEGWNRVTIRNSPEDSYYESRQRIVELTIYMNQMVRAHYGTRSTRTLIMGGSNGGHHTKWMIEDFPNLFDGGIAGYGYNGQISQWGGVAQVVRNYDIIAPRIDDIIARRNSDPDWDPFTERLTPPLSGSQLVALRNIYDIPAKLKNGFAYNAGRVPGSEAQWKAQYNALVGYLRDSIPKWDPTFNPFGGDLLDEELGLWNPAKSPGYIKQELRLLDLTGKLKRPVIIMHGTFDPIVATRETEGYKQLVEKVLGRRSRDFLAVYYIPGMGHGGAQYDAQVPAQIDALEAWIDYHRSNGRIGSPAPDAIGPYPRVGPGESGLPPIPTAKVQGKK